MSPPSRIISRQAFASANQAYFAPASLSISEGRLMLPVRGSGLQVSFVDR
jgi:hypothetical protein